MSTKPPSDYTAATTADYDAHAAEFCANTAAVDMSELYAPFRNEISAGDRILDAGCGSGRDSWAFLQKGYPVVSIDASPEMVSATTKLTGQSAILMRFDELDFDSEFDGIWACASLLHIARQDLQEILDRLTKALKPGGVLYLSFKHGDAERVENGRFFNDLNDRCCGLLLPTIHNWSWCGSGTRKTFGMIAEAVNGGSMPLFDGVLPSRILVNFRACLLPSRHS